MAGNPEAVVLLAPFLSFYHKKMNIGDLYDQLLSPEISQVLEAEGIKEENRKSLTITSEATVQLLATHDRESFYLLFFLGLFPAGVNEQSLSSMWGGSYKDALETLHKVSLTTRSLGFD